MRVERTLASLISVGSLLVLVGGVTCWSAGASASPSGGSQQTPPPGGLEVIPDEEEPAPFEPVVLRERLQSRDYTVKPRVSLFPWRADYPRRYDLRALPRIEVDAAVVVLSVPDSGGYADVYPTELKGELTFNGVRREIEPALLSGYQGGQKLARFAMKDVDSPNVRAQVSYEITSYETEIDEERAMQIEWHTELFEDPVVVSSLAPQLYIESDDPFIVRLVEEWTNGEPKRVKPYMLAKYLAGKVVEYYQPSEGYLEADDRVFVWGGRPVIFLEGFNVDGAAVAARRRDGSPFDMANLLTAVYRAAGLPARVVIGYDERLDGKRGVAPFIAWVEFYLHHPEAKRGEWVPVDIVKQREFSSQAPPLERRWEYFGRNDDSEHYCPLGHHWKPPTAVVTSGEPTIWGWLPQNEDGREPRVDGSVDVQVIETPLSPTDEDFKERQERRMKRGGGG